MRALITIVIPIYNESDNIKIIAEEIKRELVDYDYEILFVNDGSIDNSLLVLEDLCLKNANMFYINFARNFGHQYALKAGIDFAKGDCVISMDGDMQHPIYVVKSMIEKWIQGFEIVITKRQYHEGTPLLKKIFSRLFYWFLNKISTIKINYGEADFRLLDRKVVEIFKKINEPNLFLRGVARWVGFKVAEISYKADKRFIGHSKYSFKKMVSLAVNGILAFSTRPLYISLYIGFSSALISVVVLIYVIISFIVGKLVPGWASTLIIVSFFSGVQLTLLGIIGLYIGKVFIQSKNRPLYIISHNNYEIKK